jgi:hypothetical protein
MLRLALALAIVSCSALPMSTMRRLTSNPSLPPGAGGYSPPTNVVPHATLDLDQAGIESNLAEDPMNYAAARSTYNNGGLSQKPTKSIASFSTAAESKMAANKEFIKYYAYYGDYDYAHKWVTGSLDGTAVTYASGRGNADFAAVNDGATRKDATKKGTVFLNFWMFALYEFEAGIELCVSGSTANEVAVHRWDEGVAFFVGSLQTTMDTSSGKLMYALSQKRCANFMTCGAEGGLDTGISRANTKVLEAMTAGKDAIMAGQCTDVRAHLDTITAHGSVALIQGAIKYAWYDGTDTRSLKAKAEAAAFSAAIVPRVHACNAADAATIYDNLKIGATSTDFQAVKTAFENNYGCMQIGCADVGGYAANGVYKAGASPCQDLGVGPIVGIAVGVPVVLILIVVLYLTQCKKKKKEGEKPKEGAEM